MAHTLHGHTFSPRPLTAIHGPGSGTHTPTGDGIPFSRPQTPHKELVLGFAGLGAMGYPMARNIATRLASPAVQFPLRVWNRSTAKGEHLANEVGQSKIKIVEKPEDLALECDIIITNLASDEVVKGIFQQFAAALKVR